MAGAAGAPPRPPAPAPAPAAPARLDGRQRGRGGSSSSSRIRRTGLALCRPLLAAALFLLLLLLAPPPAACWGLSSLRHHRPTTTAAAPPRRRRFALAPRAFNPRGAEEEAQMEKQQQPPPPPQQQQQQQQSTLTRPADKASLPAPPAPPPSASPQYEELMEALTDDEKYNILLQSRASSLIDALGGRGGSGTGSGSGSGTGNSSGGGTAFEFEALYRLLEEMTGKGVRLTGKSFAALMDAASLSRSLAVIQACLVQARRNGACCAFSRDVGVLAPPPSSSTSTSAAAAAAAAAGSGDSLPPVPSDDRSWEVGAGVGALAVVGGALGWEALGPLFHQDTAPASVLLLLVAAAAFFDFTQRDGREVRLALAGLNRLFLRDPEREARVQAAAFLSAYLLGLPCFCFGPTVLEAARLPAEVDDFREALGSTAGLNRLLVYLLAPVAAEAANHVQLVASDPRQARALVQLFRERNPGVEVDAEGVLLPWAFREATRLLQANGALLEKLRQRMESGGATVGDCVSLLEAGPQQGGGPGGGGAG